jgi:hypothetical protein
MPARSPIAHDPLAGLTFIGGICGRLTEASRNVREAHAELGAADAARLATACGKPPSEIARAFADTTHALNIATRAINAALAAFEISRNPAALMPNMPMPGIAATGQWIDDAHARGGS